MTIYLKFDTQEQAISALTAEGYEMSQYSDHCHKDVGSNRLEGTLFQIPDGDTFLDGWYSNLFDCEQCPVSLEQYRVPDPETPYNVRA